MLKKLFLILTFATICAFCEAQETLIYHTSFEIDSNKYCDHSTLFNGYDTLGLDFKNFYQGIFNALNTPDIFSPCDSFWYYQNNDDSIHFQYKNGWPNNYWGFQYPHSGNNYAGTLSYIYPFNTTFLTEWIGLKLPMELIKNRFYRIEYYISVADYSGYFTPAPQVCFTVDSIFGGYVKYLSNVDIESNPLNNADISFEQEGIVTDTVNWIKITGLFKSNGSEKYVYVGNFYSNLQTLYASGSSSPNAQNITYYYIDDFSIYDIDSTVSINENIASENNVEISPNPAQDFVSIDIPKSINQAQLSIYNLTGQLISQKQITHPSQQIPITELGNGMYILVIQNGDKIIGRERLVVAR